MGVLGSTRGRHPRRGACAVGLVSMALLVAGQPATAAAERSPAYRYAQRTGNHLDDFYRQGFNSLQSPVDLTQQRAR